MLRLTLNPREDWQARVEEYGLIWHSAGGTPYWHEAACYSFSGAQIGEIERATRELYAMLLNAGQYIVDRRLFGRFGIPDWCVPLIEQAWEAEPPALNHGRFDFGYDGREPPKLFEFNCDTPTSLVEAAVVQWFWKQDVFPQAGQCNTLHEALIAKWADIAPYLADRTVHFAHVADDAGEDTLTTAYMMDLAREAGLTPVRLTMRDIGWGPGIGAAQGCFYDLDGREIRTLYKLYPWEWLVSEPFGRNIAANDGRTQWIEPIWKMIWSNKAILPILWDLYPGHPNLLWASAEAPQGDSYVAKPILAREGANVRVVRHGETIAASAGRYDGPLVYQQLYDLPDFDGARPVIGSWCVDGVPAGIGIREDGLITSNLARFVPHIVS